jgi:glycosyltransferase involved in cell wall biosynthesis/tetratricopeptide (TPR) repeat protein
MAVSDVSLCVITKDEPYLETALSLVRPFVKQIVVVLTGGSLKASEVALIDTLEEFSGINPELDCFDFSLARNRSFALAKCKHVMWMDADDEVLGIENLASEVEFLESQNNPQAQLMFPYLYAFDRRGNCTCRLDRERLMPNTGGWFWEEPVHEAVLPIGNRHARSAIQWKHHKDIAQVAAAHGRNIAILRKVVEKRPTARNVYYLGVACADGGLREEGVLWLEKFVGMSTYEDELHNAFLVLSNLTLALGKIDDAIKWAWKAVEAKEKWFESYFALCRCYYRRAEGSNDRRDWERCVHFGELALKQPPTISFQPSQPMLRAHEIFVWLSRAYDQLWQPEKALAMANEGLKAVPDDGALVFNQLLLGAAVARSELRNAARRLLDSKGKERAVDAIIEEAFALIAHDISEHFTVEFRPHIPVSPKIRQLNALPEKFDIVFACGDGWVPWDPEEIEKKGFGGGSEVAVVEMGKRLAARGHRVRVYNPCVRAGLHAGVEYIRFEEMEKLEGSARECDVLIAWRTTGYLTRFEAHLKLLWLHDIVAWGTPGQPASLEEIGRADFVLCVSEWHRQYVAANQGIPLEKILKTRNGIANPDRFARASARDPHAVIYNSSPDRGLEMLLDLWPLVRKEVPDASLQIFYGFETWKKMGHNQDAAARIEAKMLALSEEGVVYKGRVRPQELANAMTAAGCWFYPNWTFPEVSCVAAMEAQLAGLVVVSSDFAALAETVVMGAKVGKPDDFLATALAALATGDVAYSGELRHEQSIAAGMLFSLDTLTDEWVVLFKEKLAAKVVPVTLEAFEGVLP